MPTTLPLSVTRTGWSEARTAWAAFRTIVSQGIVGPVSRSSGRGSRITHFRVSTWERGTSETKSRTYSSAGAPTTSSGVPICTIAPSRRIMIRSPSLRASARSWVMKTIVLLELVVEPDHLVLHVPADQRVQRRERLVEEQQRRVAGERAGQADPLLHAAGELVGVGAARSPWRPTSSTTSMALARRSFLPTPRISSP